jgi:DNA-binding transcriptional LysR family regulator
MSRHALLEKEAVMQSIIHPELVRIIHETEMRERMDRIVPESYRRYREPIHSIRVIPALRAATSRVLIAAGTWIAPVPRHSVPSEIALGLRTTARAAD